MSWRGGDLHLYSTPYEFCWLGCLPDIDGFNYFPSSPIGQVQVIGNFQALLTNRILDPDIAGLADLTTTLTVTATPEQNGTVVQCRGDDPSERMSLTLHIASEF